MPIRTLCTLACLVASGLLAPAASAQESASFSERVEVELVDVDVWVTGKSGSPIFGLGPEDFEVLHDELPVPVSYFTEVRDGRAVQTLTVAAGETVGAETRAAFEVSPHHVVLYFDQSRLHPSSYPPLIRGLEEFLSTREVAPERVLVLRQQQSLSVEAPFGSSRKELQEALERLARGTPDGMELQAEADYAIEAIRQSWEENQDFAAAASGAGAAVPPAAGPSAAAGAAGANTGGPRATVGGVGTGGGPDACGSFLSQIQPVLSSWARSSGNRTAVTLSNLGDIASFLAGLRGLKTLLYLSDGLETEPGAALATFATGYCPAASSQLLADSKFEELTPRLLELTRHANGNRVTIHAIQATGLRSPRDSTASAGRRARGGENRAASTFARSQRTNERRGLELLSEETGGRVVYNQNEFGAELDRIARELGTYYSLAFEPPPAGSEPGHRIEVRLRDGSLIARYRHGYLDKDASRWLIERVQGALNLGITDNPLEVRLGAGTLSAGEAGTYRLPLHVMIPAERLVFLPQEGGVVAEIAVLVMTRSLDASQAYMFDRTFRIPGEPGATGLADLPIEIELPKGAHLTAVGVQDTASREASFVSTTLEIGRDG